MKILTTIGPASMNESDIRYFSDRTNLFRLNGSHANLEWHSEAVKLIRRVCPNAFILMDIPGVKPRTTNVQPINIVKGEEVSFGESGPLKTKHIELTRKLPVSQEISKYFSVNDGQFLFDTSSFDGATICGRSRDSFELLPKKGINIPFSVYDEALQFEIYEDFIKKINHMEIDGLGLSFVQTPALVEKIKEISPELSLISKIENSLGLENVEGITSVSDAIMIDRGDLIAEVGFDQFFYAVEKISKITKASGRPLIMATENLETMTERELPSKSEVISIVHSATLGVDCFMLSEETAISDNRRVIIDWLHEFVKNEFDVRNDGIKLDAGRYHLIWSAVREFKDLPAIVVSKSGRALFKFLAYKPTNRLTLVTSNKKVKKLANLYRNNITVIEAEIPQGDTVSLINKVLTENAVEIFSESDQVIAVYVSQYLKKPRANTISVFDRVDFV